jgi:hypothetical protein
MAIAIRIGIGLLLIIHGFAHYQVTRGWQASQPDRSWLLGSLGMTQDAVRAIASPLWVIALLGLLVAGFITMAMPGWWRPAVTIATILSLVVLTVFYRPAASIGVLVDVGVLVAVLWAHWPTPELVGA